MSLPSSRRLQNKVAIITGSSSGIGRAIAIAYAQEGAKVVCADLTPNARPEVEEERVTPTHELIQRNGADSLFLKTDVAEEKDMEELMTRTVAHYGRVDMSVLTLRIYVKPVVLTLQYYAEWSIMLPSLSLPNRSMNRQSDH